MNIEHVKFYINNLRNSGQFNSNNVAEILDILLALIEEVSADKEKHD